MICLYYNGKKQRQVTQMETKTAPAGLLSGNALKLIAAAAMTVDHVGVIFFPQVKWLRIIGRLAFPIFAYMIAEGCKYTRSRLRYFFTISLLAAACQAVYWFAAESTYFSVLVTFSLSIPVICALQFFRESLSDGHRLRAALAVAALISAVALVWYLNRILTIDYGFWGCMLPVFAALFQQRRGSSEKASPLDRNEVHVLCLGFGLLCLHQSLGGLQIWSVLSLPLLLCYSGRRGKGNLKYFFYIFYPAHLAILQGLDWLLAAL